MTDTAPTPLDAGTALHLLEADPDFARAVPVEDRVLADRTLTVRERRFAEGEMLRCDPREAVALLLVEGAAWREARVQSASAPQLLGPGCVLLGEPAPAELLPVEVNVVALEPCRTALLDRRYLMAAARWPRLATILHTKLAHQERELAAIAAVGQLPRVEERLMALLWHLAERWGRRVADGVHLPLRLTHATLGRFVGARRPTVSLALADLREAGSLQRRPDGTWLLRGEPPARAAPADGVAPLPPPDLFPPSAAVA